MGKFQARPKYFVVFLALVACINDISLVTHARPIKPLNQHSSLNTGKVPSPLSEKTVPSYDDVAASFEDSGATNTNAFRPTTPGGSPGVGHRKFEGEDYKNMKTTAVVVESPDVDVKHPATDDDEKSKNGFKPTNPGHSPGIGHASQTTFGQKN